MTETLTDIYADIPAIDCQRACTDSCGIVPILPAEAMALGEHGSMLGFNESVRCERLSADGLCTVYDKRPGMCRLWGVVKAMRCPFGCEPERWLTDAEAHAILNRIVAVA